MDWITELCRSFAKRCRQEAEIMENAQELIARECSVARELIVVNEAGEEMHTADRPFCAARATTTARSGTRTFISPGSMVS